VAESLVFSLNPEDVIRIQIPLADEPPKLLNMKDQIYRTFWGVGPSGCGKTFMAQQLFLMMKTPHVLALDGGIFRKCSNTWLIATTYHRPGFNIADLYDVFKATVDVKKGLFDKLFAATQCSLYIPDTLVSAFYNIKKSIVDYMAFFNQRKRRNGFDGTEYYYIGILIMQHCKQCNFPCPFPTEYKCVGCDVSGEARSSAEGKKYSSRTYRDALTIGYQVLFVDPKTKSKFPVYVHNSGRRDAKSIIVLPYDMPEKSMLMTQAVNRLFVEVDFTYFPGNYTKFEKELLSKISEVPIQTPGTKVAIEQIPVAELARLSIAELPKKRESISEFSEKSLVRGESGSRVSEDSTLDSNVPWAQAYLAEPAPLGRESVASLERESEASMERNSETPLGTELEVSPGRESEVSPGRELEVSTERESEASTKRNSEAPLSPERESQASPERKLEVSSGRESVSETIQPEASLSRKSVSEARIPDLPVRGRTTSSAENLTKPNQNTNAFDDKYKEMITTANTNFDQVIRELTPQLPPRQNTSKRQWWQFRGGTNRRKSGGFNPAEYMYENIKSLQKKELAALTAVVNQNPPYFGLEKDNMKEMFDYVKGITSVSDLLLNQTKSIKKNEPVISAPQPTRNKKFYEFWKGGLTRKKQKKLKSKKKRR
jgi:hypothetical protein